MRAQDTESTLTPLGEGGSMKVSEAAIHDVDTILRTVRSGPQGLGATDAAHRLAGFGPNAVRSHHARPWVVLGRQLRSPLLLLLAVTASLSFFVGERSDALIIGVILTASIGLGFVNEYRAELAAQALHSQIRHEVAVRRDGAWVSCDVTQLVPGDVVRLQIGEIVPADVRVLQANGLECDESVLTGESLPVEKTSLRVMQAAGIGDLSSCALMGTIVHSGSGEAVVVATGAQAEFGRIALGLGEREPETEFQVGLRRFSGMLVWVAVLLSSFILVANMVLGRPLIDALLFALAIAVGITPQLLPAVVTTSLATGSRRLAQRRVLVKRLVCIEDLGDIEVLMTDKTGTLTEGAVAFERALDPDGNPSDAVLRAGLLCNEATVDEHGSPVGGNPLDIALWQSSNAAAVDVARYRLVALAPFDHDRRRNSVLVDQPDGGRSLITKGAPEGVLERCRVVPAAARRVLDAEFAAGSRVVAVGSRAALGATSLEPDDEHDLDLLGFLVFRDPTKTSAARSLARLGDLGITVKVVTGDNAQVAATVCSSLGLAVTGSLTGQDVDALDDEALADAVDTTTVFSRVSPEQKARVIRAHRRAQHDVAFLGDGVNDALALHTADVGISVDSATDVAKDAADIILLEKDLGVLADGVVEGRRTFANTIKYVLMGTSSNFGNMFSAAAASAFLRFLPMLPSQILLNNLLYDSSQMAIPSDSVDEEMLHRPSHWDIASIRRFMVFFGPISSLFDFLTFAIMLGAFNAHAPLFRSGWFVESLATQTLVIFVIRTRRVPFFHSRPSRPLLVSSCTVVAIGALLPFSPLAHRLGFRSLPIGFFAALVVMVVVYLALVDVGKRWFFAEELRNAPRRAAAAPSARHERRVHRRAARWSHAGRIS
jgi:Mg2+-importing ATPase